MAGIIALIAKYLPAILAFKDVAETFKTEQGSDKPFYLSKRFWGVLISALGVISAILFGVKLSPEQVSTLSDGIIALITLGSAVYGVALAIKGSMDAKKRP